jgi:hypothetical protein
MSIQILNEELTNDPLGRGYSGMNDAEAAADLNTVYRTQNVESMEATVIANVIDKTQWDGLSDTDKDIIWNLLHMGTLNPWGIEADIFVDVFGAGSATITALAALRVEDISRAAELGLGEVSEGDVQKARAYPA